MLMGQLPLLGLKIGVLDNPLLLGVANLAVSGTSLIFFLVSRDLIKSSHLKQNTPLWWVLKPKLLFAM